jgi:hypothetical protein
MLSPPDTMAAPTAPAAPQVNIGHGNRDNNQSGYPDDDDYMDDEDDDDDHENSGVKKIHRHFILNWLAADNNYDLLFGEQKTKDGMKVVRKQDAWNILATEFNKKFNKRSSWNSMRSRVRRIRTHYITVGKKYFGTTGAGVPWDSLEDNVHDQVNQECEGYEKIDSLFGKSPHVRPSCEVITGKNHQVLFNSRKSTYRLGRRDDDEDWLDVGKEGGAGEMKDDEDEEEGEIEMVNYRQHASFQNHRYHPAPSITSKSSSSRKRSNRSVSPLHSSKSSKDSNVRRSGPAILQGHPPPQPQSNTIDTFGIITQVLQRRDDGE